MKIIKIVIQSESRFCPKEYVYKDKLTIVSNGVQYLYKPYIETKINPVRKWKYTTNSPIYAHLYNKICESTGNVIQYDEGKMVRDATQTKITVIFEDGHKESNLFTFSNEIQKSYFRLIKKIIPDSEYTPIVLADEDE